MKIYIYELDFYTHKTIKEHCCEAEETQRTFVSKSGKAFPAIGLKKVSKASMPRLCDQHSVISKEPLTEEKVKAIFIGNRQDNIEHHQNMINVNERQIERIAKANIEKGVSE